MIWGNTTLEQRFSTVAHRPAVEPWWQEGH